MSFQVVSETVSSELCVTVVSCINSLLCFPSPLKSGFLQVPKGLSTT